MRLIKDVRDWMELRGRICHPWRLVRSRRGPTANGGFEVRFHDGPPMMLRSALEQRAFVTIFARDEYRISALERDGLDTVIDVGANIGLFARRIAPFAKRVMSYEPVPSTFRVLTENVKGVPNVAALPRAVTDRRETARIHLFDDASGNSLFPSGRDPERDAVSVDTVTLADVFAEHAIDHCDFLKLDCEGSEYPIIFGSPRELWQRIRRVAMEYHPVAGAPPAWSGEGIAAWLRDVGHVVDLRPRGHHPGKGLLFSHRM